MDISQMKNEISCPCKVLRFKENPIISPYMLGDASENINGPTLVQMPLWAKGRLGKYHLYFSNHEGENIRLAYADNLQGPWTLWKEGVLPLSELPWATDHVASPDVLIDEEKRQIRLYFHCPTAPMLKSDDPEYMVRGLEIKQETFVAVSADGLHFTTLPASLGDSYFRVWQWRGMYYALPRQGKPLLRSPDGLQPFSAGKSPFEDDPAFAHIRHVGILVDGDSLIVCFTRIGDAPESIYLTTIAMRDDGEVWQATPPCLLLSPETGYEGANLPVSPSQFGMSIRFENAVRDPYLYREDGRIYLLYTVVAERGIAIAELTGLCTNK